MVGLALVATVVTSELRILNRILETVNLTTEQWLTCIGVSLAILVIAEAKKLLRIRTTEIPVQAADAVVR
jgi:hypothetical protein